MSRDWTLTYFEEKKTNVSISTWQENVCFSGWCLYAYMPTISLHAFQWILTNQNSQPLEIEGRINLTMVVKWKQIQPFPGKVVEHLRATASRNKCKEYLKVIFLLGCKNLAISWTIKQNKPRRSASWLD